MAKREEHEEGEGGGGMERWLLTYADMITLLLIFFIILYSLSKVNQTKFDEVAQVLKEAFGGQHSVITMKELGVLEKNLHAAKKKTKEKYSYVQAVSAFQKEIEAKKVHVLMRERGIVISLASDFYFGSGSADLTDEALGVLEKLSEILSTMPNNVKIEGHTDNVPITPGGPLAARYPTNWELSSQRAVNVLKYLESRGIDPKRVSAVAYADTRPLKPNDTENGRTLNRRVEIVIVNEQPARSDIVDKPGIAADSESAE
jgi:chemotaxis protein MotB